MRAALASVVLFLISENIGNPAPLAAQSFTVGSRVHVTAPVYARTDTLGVGTKVLRTTGDKGTITGGPAGSSTVYGLSWFIHYDTPPDGWSTAQYLALDVVAPVAVASVVVTPAMDTLLPGQTVQLTATTLSATGAVLPGRVVTWSPIGGQLVSVSATGLLTANIPGLGGALATSEGKQGENRTLVLASPPPPPPPPPPPSGTTVLPRVTALRNLPPAISFPVRAAVPVEAVPLDSADDPLGNVVTWTVADSSVVRVTRAFANLTQGVTLLGLAVGTTTVTASVGSVRAVSAVTITPPAPPPPVLAFVVSGVHVRNLPSAWLVHWSLPFPVTLYSAPAYELNYLGVANDTVARGTCTVRAP